MAFLTLLGTRLTLGADAAGEGLELLSGWNFSTAQSVAALMVRTDVLGLSFLIPVILALLAVILAFPPPPARSTNGAGQGALLTLGAGTCLLFVSANGLTIAYAVLAFDVLAAIYWLRRGQIDLSVARLFLGIFYCERAGSGNHQCYARRLLLEPGPVDAPGVVPFYRGPPATPARTMTGG